MKVRYARILSLMLCGCIALALVGCDSSTSEGARGEETVPTPDDRLEEAYDMELAVRIDLDGARQPISKYIYGQFIEHIEDGVYDGIWAEMLLDRKFYYEIGRGGLSPWQATDADKTSSDGESTLSNGYAAHIMTGGGITQGKLSLTKKEYSGYFYAKSPTGGKVVVSLSYKDQSVSTEVLVEPNDDFTKYTFSLDCDFAARGGAVYRLELTEGEGWFDSLSLMPADNYKGMRRDTLDALKELNSPIYRWPGGNFLSGWDWVDGIGNIDERPSRRNLHYMGLESDFDSAEAMETSDVVKLNSLGFYGGIEPNDFGLDEFMAMCEYLDADALMMVNTGLGSVEAAVNQLQYCNGDATTEFGALRAQNGHEEPYNIRYWGIGNEMFGDWQLGHVGAVEYMERHNAFVNAMRQVDSSISFIASGENTSSWDKELFANCAGNFDLVAEHGYPKRNDDDVFGHVSNMRVAMEDRAKKHRELLMQFPEAGSVTIAFTEYSYDKAVCPSRLKDGLGVAALLNVMINNADIFEMACYSSTVNTTQGCITTEAEGAVLQGAGYVLKLYSDYMQPNAIPAQVKYNERCQLDISAAVSDDGKTVTLAVVNPSELAVRLNGAVLDRAVAIERHSFTGDFPDSFNAVSHQELYLEDAQGLANAVAPPMSLSIFVIHL